MYQKSISEISVMPYPFTNKTTSLKYAMSTAAKPYYCHFELRSYNKQEVI